MLYEDFFLEPFSVPHEKRAASRNELRRDARVVVSVESQREVDQLLRPCGGKRVGIHQTFEHARSRRPPRKGKG